MNRASTRMTRLLASLFLTMSAAIIPNLPDAALAQQTVLQQQRVLHNFDLLLLSDSQQKDAHHSQSIMLVSTKQQQLDNLVIQLPRLEVEDEHYDHVSSDPESDTVYWTTNTGCIGFFRVTNKSYGVMINETGNSKINAISYESNQIYWVENMRFIKSMRTDAHTATILVDVGDQETIQGLTVANGTLYYSAQRPTSRTSGSIWSLNTTSNVTATASLVIANLSLPTSLSMGKPRYLHWISNPPGIYFHVENLDTDKPSEKSVIMKQAHQHANSLAVSCGGVFWTDSSKRVWVKDTSVRKSSRYNRIPGGKQVGANLLAEQADWRFLQVAAVPRECDNVVLSEEDAKSVNTGTTTTTLSSFTATSRSTPATTVDSSSTSSSESEEEHVKKAASLSGIRICTDQEFSRTCSPSAEIICVVIGSMQTPVCLSEHQRTAATQPESNTTAQMFKSQPSTTSTLSSWPQGAIIIVSVLSTLATVMTLISLYMTIRVRNLSKKPIIRRRVVVSTRTSESGSSSPASVCEMIDIENCCNMNVCETPCYERTLLQPSNPNNSSTCTTSTTQNGSTIISVNSSNSNWGVGGCGGLKNSVKEDKKCLLR